jgi:hypothetical protein
MDRSNSKYCNKSFKKNRDDAKNETVCSQINIIENIYNAIVLSHFDYCSLVWSNCCKYLIDKLQKLQNRAAQIITEAVTEIPEAEIPEAVLYEAVTW